MLGRAEIALLIPHGPPMCLLERVVDWDASGIRCASISHRDQDNPLREANGLPVWAGIEYATQAAAIHGALLAGRKTARPGVLASLREVRANCRWLHVFPGEIVFRVTLVLGDPAGAIYRFDACADGELLVGGQIALMFNPSTERADE